ncbi:serine/threonine protein kinase [Streptomyces lasiicapitis]|uniref:serine/threonine protein kinase n=1 Tax=Streptomyces lasiicapitis TaxID=1923961 RepID=UPI00369C55AC
MLGTLLKGRYRVVRKIGGGGEGEIFLARDLELRRDVVIKFQNPRGFESTMTFIDRGKSIEQEYCLLEIMKSLPGIPKVFDKGELGRNSSKYLVMERVRGITVAEWISEHHPVPIKAAVSAIAQICEILGGLHAEDYIHRDVTPNNTMIQMDGRIRLLDVGISVRTGELNTNYGGSPRYAAPEQFDPEAVLTPHLDVFAVGMLFFEMVASDLPYSGEERPLETATAPFPKDFAIEMPDCVRSFALAMVAIAPHERPNVFEVSDYLRHMLPVPNSPASPKATRPDPTAPYRLRLSLP